MPYAHINGTRLYYETSGSGPETLLFSHGLLLSGRMFAAQVAHFAPRYRVVTYDHRGQGRSDVPPGGYDMDSLAEDALALIAHLGLGPVHFVGLSMGGFVGLRLAARQPESLRSLCLLASAAATQDERLKYGLLRFMGGLIGIRPMLPQVMRTMFGRSFLQDPKRGAERAFWAEQLGNNPRHIVRAVGGVLRRAAVLDELAAIRCPTLILVGDEDVATPYPRSAQMKAGIAGAQLYVLKPCGHSPSIEQAGAVNHFLERFLAELG